MRCLSSGLEKKARENMGSRVVGALAVRVAATAQRQSPFTHQRDKSAMPCRLALAHFSYVAAISGCMRLGTGGVRAAVRGVRNGERLLKMCPTWSMLQTKQLLLFISVRGNFKLLLLVDAPQHQSSQVLAVVPPLMMSTFFFEKTALHACIDDADGSVRRTIFIVRECPSRRVVINHVVTTRDCSVELKDMYMVPSSPVSVGTFQNNYNAGGLPGNVTASVLEIARCQSPTQSS